jgi:hypothetical protein
VAEEVEVTMAAVSTATAGFLTPLAEALPRYHHTQLAFASDEAIEMARQGLGEAGLRDYLSQHNDFKINMFMEALN